MNAADDERIDQLRARVHKLADTVQGHDGQLIQINTVVPLMSKQFEALRADAATRESVSSLFNALQAKIDANSERYELKLLQIQSKLDPIQKGVYAVVWLVFSAIILAILGLVLIQGRMP